MRGADSILWNAMVNQHLHGRFTRLRYKRYLAGAVAQQIPRRGMCISAFVSTWQKEPLPQSLT